MADSEVQKLQAELAALRREMQDFTYIVSHDLRAPLRHIVSFAGLVQEDAGPQLSPEVQGFLGTITDSAQHLGRMLDALLELSRVGTVPLQMAAVPLQDLVHQLCAEQPAGAVQWRVAPDLPTVQADPQLLALALRQLLDNAVKFSANQTAAMVEVRAQGQTLLVQDNGVGFNPVMQEKLFQPFCRLHSAKEFSGLGMGLALAHKALARMGADLRLQSGPGCTASIRWL